MPTEARDAPGDDRAIADRRILRLALGTSLCLWVSQAVAWELSFIAPIVTLLLLSMPPPPPGLRKGIVLVAALVLPATVAGIVLLPFFATLHGVAILLVMLALFHSFYFTARGGPAIVGTFLAIGIAVVVAIGSVNAAALGAIVTALGLGAASGLVFAWIAYALLPDVAPPGAPANPVRPPTPSLAEARRLALRAFAVVAPIAILFLFSPSSATYVVVMVKAASMGQQSEVADSRQIAKSLIVSTLWGGFGAIVAWQLLSIWPSLILYTLIVAIAALAFGRRIFHGAGFHADAATWPYAFLTMIVLVGPAVLDAIVGAPAGAAFWTRLFLVVLTAVWGSLAITVFEAFWPRQPAMQ